MRRAVLSATFVALAACGGTETRTGPHAAARGAPNADEALPVDDAPPPPDPRIAVRLDMVPGSSTNAIGYGGKQTEVIFAIVSSPEFDARKIDPATVTLGDEQGTDTPLAKNKNGTWKFVYTYVNADFLPDFYGYVNKAALKTNGDLTLETTSLTALAALKAPDAAVLVRGKDMVKVVP